MSPHPGSSLLAQAPFWRRLGLELLEAEAGRARVRLALSAGDSVSGGLLASLVDAALGAALRSLLEPQERAVTLNLHLGAVGESRAALWLGAEACAERRAPDLGWGRARVSDSSGALLVEGSATFFVTGSSRADARRA